MRIVSQPFEGQAWPLWHEGRRLMHFPILKNGHSSLSARLSAHPFLFATYLRNEKFEPDGWPEVEASFAVLRHPFDRYVSGLAQMWRSGYMADLPWDLYIDAVERFNRRTETPWTRRGDRHFLPQSTVVERMPYPRVLWSLNGEGLAAMWRWLEEPGTELDRQKQTDAELVDYARGALSRGIVERHYAADVELWGTAL